MGVEFEILTNRQFAIERERLRHVADIRRASVSLAPMGLPNSFAVPSVAGRRPVSIFMVVDLRSRSSLESRKSRHAGYESSHDRPQ